MATSRQRFLFSAPGTYYIDLNRTTSIQERKLHRGMMTRHVKGGIIKDSNNESVVRINVAPHTWVTKTALRRSKKIYDRMVNEAMKEGHIKVKPRYHDYKVYLNTEHANGGGTELTPVDAAGNTIPTGEWVRSMYTTEDYDWNNGALIASANRNMDEFTAHIVGDNLVDPSNPNWWKSVGAIRSWLKTRPEPDQDQPDLPSGLYSDPLANLFDEADSQDEIMQNLNEDNDQAPYDEDELFGFNTSATGTGTELQRVAMAATQSGAGQIAGLSGFSAICGLIQVHITQGSGSGEVELLLDVETKGEKL